MKKSKRARASRCKDGVDRIGNLPDPILHIILSRLLSTEEVIRTSILSTRWRYLWTSVPSLDIDFSRGLKPSKEWRRKKCREFIGRVLANRSLHLNSFRLCCSDYYNMSTIGQWIHGAVTRNVKLLDLMFCPIEESKVITLPHFLVTCGSLEVLRLCLFGRFLSLPNITGFPTVRVLELNNVKLQNDNIVKGFLKSCPLLEDLSLKDCLLNELTNLCIECPNLKNLYIDSLDGISGIDFEEVEGSPDGPNSLQISCPKLEFLELTGYIVYYRLIFESLDSLKKVVIHCENIDDGYMHDSIYEWFVGISHVESLSLSLHFIILCSFGVSWCRPRRGIPKSLPNLKTLELTIKWVVMHSETANKLFKILLCFPNLESLHLKIQKQISWSWGWTLDLYEDEKRRLLTRHLKRVEFLEFHGENEELVTVRSLLEHGKVLEKMIFGWGNEALYHEKSIKTMKEVSKFRKASSTVKLVTLLNK